MSRSFKGKNYNTNLGTKEIAKIVRDTLKKEFRDCKFSVTIERYSGGSSITIALISAPFEVLKSGERYRQLNQYYLDRDKDLTPKGKAMMKRVNEIIKSFHRDNSDPMTDYFCVNFYYSLHVGKGNKDFEVK